MKVDACTNVIAMQLQNINPIFKDMTDVERQGQGKVFAEEIKRKIES